jgi:RNA polymerase sigma-70 factor, ECF subfamily
VSEPAQQLLARLPSPRADGWEPEAVAELLGAVVEQAHARWPELALEQDALVELLAGSLDVGAPPASAFAAVHAADLWLAHACAQGDRAALDAFERELMPVVDRALGRTQLAAPSQAELRQRVRASLFVSRGAAGPAIAGYAGRAPLVAWLRVVAAREAAALARSDHHLAADDDEIDGMVEQALDPELQLDHQAYRDELRGAFAEAFARLGTEDRNLLRMNLLDRVGIDEIAAMHTVHRATAARWIKRVREQLFDDTRRGLMRRLRLSPSEFDSALRLVRSQLDVSIARHLRGG